MSNHDAEANKDAARRIEEAWSANDMEALDGLIAQDFVAHTPGSEMVPPGLEGAKMAHAGAMQSFPDRQVAVEDVIGEGDRVFVRCRMQGVNSGGLPWAGVPANGNSIDIEYVTEFRFEDGKVVETWAQMDVAKMMQQLGAMPAPGA